MQNVQFEKLTVREQIVKTVVKSGNGGAVWVPKDWLGQEVVVILPARPKIELKQRIIQLLTPYLEHIVSAGIYGSYSRREQNDNSDIDVLILTKDNILLNIKDSLEKDIARQNFRGNFSHPENAEKFDFTVFSISKFKQAIKEYPVMYYQMAQEAEPLINASVFEELRSVKVNSASLLTYLKDTSDHIKSNISLLELDKLEDNHVSSYSVLYSTILRLRGLFIIRCIVSKIKFSNAYFKTWVIQNSIQRKEFDRIYKVFSLIRDNKYDKHGKRLNKSEIQVGPQIKISVVEHLLDFLQNELNILENQFRK